MFKTNSNTSGLHCLRKDYVYVFDVDDRGTMLWFLFLLCRKLPWRSQGWCFRAGFSISKYFLASFIHSSDELRSPFKCSRIIDRGFFQTIIPSILTNPLGRRYKNLDSHINWPPGGILCSKLCIVYFSDPANAPLWGSPLWLGNAQDQLTFGWLPSSGEILN